MFYISILNYMRWVGSNKSAEVIDADTNCQLYVEVTTLKVL